MTKIVTAAVTTLFLTASPLAYAQAPGAGALQRLSTADVTALTDARINLVKAALQLTPDQEKYWPAIEEAIRARAKDRQARLQNVEARITELRSKSPVEAMRDRNPVDFLHRRAEALTQRAADLKKLADAWQPLYPTLSQEQKRRMAALTIFVFQSFSGARTPAPTSCAQVVFWLVHAGFCVRRRLGARPPTSEGSRGVLHRIFGTLSSRHDHSRPFEMSWRLRHKLNGRHEATTCDKRVLVQFSTSGL